MPYGNNKYNKNNTIAAMEEKVVLRTASISVYNRTNLADIVSNYEILSVNCSGPAERIRLNAEGSMFNVEYNALMFKVFSSLTIWQSDIEH